MEAEVGVVDFEDRGGAVTQGMLEPGRGKDTDLSLRASRRKTAMLTP